MAQGADRARRNGAQVAAVLHDLEGVRTLAELAAVLRRLRRRAARRDGAAPLTFRQLAERTGWSRGAIGGYFGGQNLPPTDRFDVLIRLLGATGPEVGMLATARDRVEESRRVRTASGAEAGRGRDLGRDSSQGPSQDAGRDSSQDPSQDAGRDSSQDPSQARARRSRTPAQDAAPPPVPHQLPPDPPRLVGRERELSDLTTLLSDTTAWHGTTVALHGPAGVGKSALAIQVAHRLGEHFPHHRLYVDLRGTIPGERPLPRARALHQLLHALGAPGPPPADEAEAAARYRELAARQRLLIVLDNAHDAAQVRPLLPTGPHCAAVVTCRRALAVVNGAVHLHVPLLTPAASLALLSAYAGTTRTAADPAAAETVARLCGHLPLALRIAGARLAARPAWPVAALAARLADPRRRLDELSYADLAVRATLDSGYRELLAGDAADRRAARALPLLAAVGDALDARQAAAATGTDLDTAEESLERLVDAQLLRSDAPGHYGFHPLTRLFAQHHLDTPAGHARP
ncbi:AAA family ATPase [Streptomyces boninensis]|uniref:AAA family ATPase n=1 Tax=Streptomyces boninensis TaxID=2039455 RepID=UPI003B222D3F